MDATAGAQLPSLLTEPRSDHTIDTTAHSDGLFYLQQWKCDFAWEEPLYCADLCASNNPGGYPYPANTVW